MKWCCLLLSALGLFLAGCKTTAPTIPVEKTYGQYHAPQFDWRTVNRVILLPLINETSYPYADEEVRRALAAELQKMGRFEVVLAAPDVHAPLSEQIRQGGSFNEALFVDLCRIHRADLILLGGMTHYQPYVRPRIGLTIQAISPENGKVVAYVDGLWDSTQETIADQARAFYRRERSCGQAVLELAVGRCEEEFAEHLVLESPHLYQRFVTNQAAQALTTLPTPSLPSMVMPLPAPTGAPVVGAASPASKPAPLEPPATVKEASGRVTPASHVSEPTPRRLVFPGLKR